MLNKFAKMVKEYLRDREPEKFRQLKKEKYLSQYCLDRAAQAYREKESLMAAGMRDDEANEVVIRDLLTIP